MNKLRIIKLEKKNVKASESKTDNFFFNLLKFVIKKSCRHLFVEYNCLHDVTFSSIWASIKPSHYILDKNQ